MYRNARPLTGAATKNKPKWQSRSTFAQLRVSSITANWTRQWRNGTYDTTGSYIVTTTLNDFSMLNARMKQMIATIIYCLKIHKNFLDISLELPWFMHSKQLNTSCMTKTLWDTSRKVVAATRKIRQNSVQWRFLESEICCKSLFFACTCKNWIVTVKRFLRSRKIQAWSAE